MSRPHRLAPAAAAAAVAALGLVTACGSTSASSTGSASRPVTARLPLATSIGGPGQPAWAVVQMGGSAARHDNFWELFARQAGSSQWTLATPGGVASNGGLIMAASGTGLVAGFGPSQDLTFSPLASATAPAAAWAQSAAPVSPGLVAAPDALASAAGGELLALTKSGAVLRGKASGTAWTRLVSLRQLAASQAGRACGLTALTAVGFAASGAAEVAGACARPGTAGIFRQLPGGWQQAGPELPAALAAYQITVLGLATSAGLTSAVLEAVTPKASDTIAAWSQGSAGSWQLSPLIRGGNALPRSLDIWMGGRLAVVLPDGSGATIAGPGASWHDLPALPARTATLALGPAGQLEALAADGQRLSVWQLAARGAGWRTVQQIRVQIPYGSSG